MNESVSVREWIRRGIFLGIGAGASLGLMWLLLAVLAHVALDLITN